MWVDVLQVEWVTFALPVLLVGMSKGGVPIGAVAAPLLILLWPDQTDAARQAVAFLLPLLCAMDLVAVGFYRSHIRWPEVARLLPGALAGVGVGTAVFVAGETTLLSLSERTLELCIGALGVTFVVLEWRLPRKATASPSEVAKSSGHSALYGFGAGVSSTIAHASGPVIQVYLLQRDLAGKRFAGTAAGFYFVLNLVKLVPFIWFARIDVERLALGVRLLPAVPLGVAAGYLIVRTVSPPVYRTLVQVLLLATSGLLLLRAGLE